MFSHFHALLCVNNPPMIGGAGRNFLSPDMVTIAADVLFNFFTLSILIFILSLFLINVYHIYKKNRKNYNKYSSSPSFKEIMYFPLFGQRNIIFSF